MRTGPLFLILMFSLIILSGCALHGTRGSSNPADSTSTNAHLEPFVIYATSDIEGAVLPSLYSSQGGLAELSGLFNSIKKEFGDGKTIWLDGGHLDTHLGPLEITATFNKELKLSLFSVGKIKIGVLGSGEDSGQDILGASQSLRSQGADIVVLLTDLPIYCRNHPMTSNFTHKANEPQGFCDGRLVKILEELPIGTIDLAIVSGTEQEIHQFVFPHYSMNPAVGIPVVSSAPKGASAHLLHFYVDQQHSGSRKIVFEKTRIEGPVAISNKTKWKGKTISPDSRIQTLVEPLLAERNLKNKDILGKFTNDLEVSPTRESSLADWLADIMRVETHSDIAIVPLGIFKNSERAEIASGAFSQADLAALFPDAMPIVPLELKGEELKTLIRIAENGSHGFSSVSGIRLKILRPEDDVPQSESSDLNGDHKIQLWEINRLRGTELSDSDLGIQSKSTYRVAVPLTLAKASTQSDLNAMNDFKWVSKELDLPNRIKGHLPDAPTDLRAVLAGWLHQNPVVSEPAPRIEFVKLKAARTERRTHHRSRSRRKKKAHK